ncbi:hypothetical protein [Clostridium sp.]|nr:hypothetical protein [Clostridium sp.]MDR3595288.1 hypothetical protein [Clostridium sp.]
MIRDKNPQYNDVSNKSYYVFEETLKAKASSEKLKEGISKFII